MNKVFSLLLICPVVLFSCKTAHIYNIQQRPEVTYIGYVQGGKQSFTSAAYNNRIEEKNTSSKQGNSLLTKKLQLTIADPEISFQNTSFTYPQNNTREIGVHNTPKEEILAYAIALKKYAIENGFDTTYAMLANMGQLSNTKRMYLVNLSTMEIIDKGLVSHGRGKGASIFVKQYSNTPGSNCTSLGKYKIMGSYKGSYGFSYRLDGLEGTNNNALKRSIVLHSMGCIPDNENYAPACVSEGCPAVSTQFLSNIQPLIEERKEPMLFWIFDSLLQEVVIEPKNKNSNTASLVASNKP